LIVLYIGLAGAVGSLLRFAFGLAIEPLYSTGSFPLATLLINYIGCYSLAWLIHASAARLRLTETMRTTIGTGLIGSFTTFSTFSMETISLLDEQEWGKAVVYVALSLCGGLFFAWLGEKIVTRSDRGRSASEGGRLS
jgi:fluoride exporter